MSKIRFIRSLANRIWLNLAGPGGSPTPGARRPARSFRAASTPTTRRSRTALLPSGEFPNFRALFPLSKSSQKSILLLEVWSLFRLLGFLKLRQPALAEAEPSLQCSQMLQGVPCNAVTARCSTQEAQGAGQGALVVVELHRRSRGVQRAAREAPAAHHLSRLRVVGPRRRGRRLLRVRRGAAQGA